MNMHWDPPLNARTMMVIGHSKLSSSTATKDISGILAVGLVIETKYGVIISCESNLSLADLKRYPESLVIGYSLLKDFDEMVEVIEKKYLGASTAAFIAALADAQRKYILRLNQQLNDLNS